MDCNTARVYLQLGGHDADELQKHLDGCAACHRLAMDEKRLDEHLGDAMRAVEVPRGLKEELLQRLDAERGAQHRRSAGKWMRYGLLAAAAAVLVFGGAWWMLYGPNKPVIAAEEVLHGANLTRAGDAEQANKRLRKLGGVTVRAVGGAPSFVNYTYLKGTPALAILPGTEETKPIEVPQLIFTKGAREAFIYCVPRDKYRIDELENPAHGYKYDLEVYYPDKEKEPDDYNFVYFILHTGGPWRDWLKVKMKE